MRQHSFVCRVIVCAPAWAGRRSLAQGVRRPQIPTELTSDQVRQLVEAAIGDQWQRSNLHRVDLRTCLIAPRKLTFVTAKDEREVEAWLVLLENPKGTLGYGVAYDEQTQRFGLVQLAKGYEPCVLGLYGGFYDALDAM